MAIQVNAGLVKRDDLLKVDPFEVILIEEKRGRFEAPSEGWIIHTALSMMDHGQVQSVEARRRKPDRKLVVTLGYTRTAAARMIVKGFHAPHPTTGEDCFYQDENFRLKVVVNDCDEQTAAVRNEIENVDRKSLTPIDRAHQHKRYRDQWGWTNQDIADKLGEKNTANIERYQGLLALNLDHQRLIHRGEMTVEAATLLLKLPEEDRAAAIESNLVNGKVKTAGLRETARNAFLDDIVADDDGETSAEGNGHVPAEQRPVKPPRVSRTRKEIVKWFSLRGDDEAYDPALRDLCKSFVKFAEGRLGDKAFENAVVRFWESEAEEE